MNPLLLVLLNTVAQEATIGGTVSLNGPVPEPKTFNTRRLDAEKLYPDGVTYSPIRVDQDKRVESAFVYVKSGLEGRTFEVPSEPKTLDFENFQLTPRVLGIMAGQRLIVTNKEAAFHAVHALPRIKENKEFNTGLPSKGMTKEATFARPEVAIRIVGEDHHRDWEVAWVAVLPHPFYAVTDARGDFEIKGLPPGGYEIEAWQEHCAPVVQRIEVNAGQKAKLNFALEARKNPK